MISALISIRANCCAVVPPELLSLIPPVSGLFAPQDIRPDWAAAVPLSNPGAKTNLLLGPKAWQVGITSLATIVEVRALPPRPTHSAGTSSVVVVKLVMLTRKILSMVFVSVS